MLKNLVFDFGNVLLTIDEQATYRAVDALLDPAKCGDLFTQVLHPFEKGLISEEAFFHRLQRRSKQILQFELYYKAWNAMFGEMPERRLKMLSELKSKYRLFLLSNTNITHIRFVHRLLEKQNGITDFEKRYFDKAYYSHEIRIRKPEAEIYQFVINDSACLASETLFIDDRLENVVAAQQQGWKAQQHDPSLEITEVIESYILNAS